MPVGNQLTGGYGELVKRRNVKVEIEASAVEA